jgi:hypothetical protein
MSKQVTVTLEDWEEALIEFIRDGYKDATGEDSTEEEVIHGFMEFFIIMKATEELPPEIIAAYEGGDVLH